MIVPVRSHPDARSLWAGTGQLDGVPPLQLRTSLRISLMHQNPLHLTGRRTILIQNIIAIGEVLFMEQAIFFGALLVMLLVVIYLSGKKKNRFLRHFSRGAFMRDLNKKMEEK